MITELPAYKAAGYGVQLDRTDVDKYTQAVLEFWNTHTKALPNWHKAARMIFAISANSCAQQRRAAPAWAAPAPTAALRSNTTVRY